MDRIAECTVVPVQVARSYSTVSSQEMGVSGGKILSDFVIIEARTDAGRAGIGEMSDLPNGFDERVRLASHLAAVPIETAAAELEAEAPDFDEIRAEIERYLLGKDPFQVQSILQEYRRANRSRLLKGDVFAFKACWAISMVLYDLIGKTLNTPVYNLLGGKAQASLPISWVAYIRSTSALEQEIQARLEQGFRAFKLKVGADPDLDLARVKMVRSLAGPTALIKIDAMASWSVDEAIDRIHQLEEYGLYGVETPVSYTDAEQTAMVRKAVNAPIIEHVYNHNYGLLLWAENAVDMINVMPTITSGLDEAKAYLNMGVLMNAQIVLGSDVELGPGTAAALHLGASCPAVTAPSDLVGPGMYLDDVITNPFKYEEGHLVVRDLPGLGIELDHEKLESLRCPLDSFPTNEGEKQ